MFSQDEAVGIAAPDPGAHRRAGQPSALAGSNPAVLTEVGPRTLAARMEWVTEMLLGPRDANGERTAPMITKEQARELLMR